MSNPRTALFHGKVLLAPMVRVCSPGFRQMCASHGADVVFTEEVVAAKVATCVREVVTYPTVTTPMAEYVSYDAFKNAFKRSVVLATPVRDSTVPKVVLQLGVADPTRGAVAVTVCAADIDGVDLNMGCPKKFSVHNGFGAALMRKPDVAGAILRAVHAAANSVAAVAARDGRRLAISLKTRLLATAEETVTMLRTMLIAAQHTAEAPVVQAITLHARTPDQRSETAPLYERAAEVVKGCRADALFSCVCFVLNGSVLSREDGESKCAQYGFDASMIARAALEDARCFAPASPAASSFSPSPTRTPAEAQAYAMAVMKEVYFYSVRYRTIFNNFKYHLTRAFPVVEALKPLMETVQLDLRSYADCFDFFSLSAEERDLVAQCAHTMELLAESPTASRKRAASPNQELIEAGVAPPMTKVARQEPPSHQEQAENT